MPLAAISIKSWSGTMQNLHGSALVQRAQCHVSHEQRPARFSLLSSERAKGSLIVSSAHFIPSIAHQITSVTDAEVPHSVTQLMSNVTTVNPNEAEPFFQNLF